MSDENGNDGTNAQAPEAPAEQQQNVEVQGQNGIQKRIDELTARFHEEAGKRQAVEAAYAQLVATQGQARQAAPAPVDEADQAIQALEAQYGSEMAQTMKRALAAVEAKFQRQIGATQAVLENQAVVRDVEQFVATKGIKDPRVEARAKELIVAWRNNGLKLTPQDATTFAMGELQLAPQQPRQVDGRYAPVDPVLTAASAPPAAAPQRGGRPPANFNSMSADQQLQWFDANGVGDKPF